MIGKTLKGDLVAALEDMIFDEVLLRSTYSATDDSMEITMTYLKITATYRIHKDGPSVNKYDVFNRLSSNWARQLLLKE